MGAVTAAAMLDMDFAISVYPGYLVVKNTVDLAPSIRIPAGTPPVFLVHAGDDSEATEAPYRFVGNFIQPFYGRPSVFQLLEIKLIF